MEQFLSEVVNLHFEIFDLFSPRTFSFEFKNFVMRVKWRYIFLHSTEKGIYLFQICDRESYFSLVL